MARYKTVDIRIWLDEKFVALDEGSQLLFIYLLTSQNTTQIGTLAMPINVLAAWLRKDIDTVSKRLDILSRNGLIRVDTLGLIWIRNYLKYNPPANPKVAAGYCEIFDEMPDSDLIPEIVESVLKACELRGEEYFKQVEKLEKLAQKSSESSNGIDTVSEPYRYQEQEQEQYISTNVDKKKNKKEKSQPLEKPEDVTDTTWNDFSLLRNKLKAPLTQTALNAIRKEAEKAGISLEDALKTCCMRGWRGFKSDWIRPKNGTGYVRQTTAPAQEDFMRDDYWANEPEEMIP